MRTFPIQDPPDTCGSHRALMNGRLLDRNVTDAKQGQVAEREMKGCILFPQATLGLLFLGYIPASGCNLRRLHFNKKRYNRITAK